MGMSVAIPRCCPTQQGSVLFAQQLLQVPLLVLQQAMFSKKPSVMAAILGPTLAEMQRSVRPLGHLAKLFRWQMMRHGRVLGLWLQRFEVHQSRHQ